MANCALSSNDRDRLMGSSYVSGNRHERMGRTLQTSAAENEARERKAKQVLFYKLCTRRQKLEHGASFLFQIAAQKVQLLQFLMNQCSCLRHLTVRLSLLSVTRKFPGEGTARYGLYRHVPLWRVWFSSSLLQHKVYKSERLGLE